MVRRLTADPCRDLAEAAGVSPGLIDHHFGSEHDLLVTTGPGAASGAGDRVSMCNYRANR
ncbi:hypothetical protein Acsp03_02280 [Actinomadura sp. NBRC 104412]|nr:hypothetical protein Acsp03_02280 [Actinomadura sp. NBRC 104412]